MTTECLLFELEVPLPFNRIAHLIFGNFLHVDQRGKCCIIGGLSGVCHENSFISSRKS